MRDDDLAHAAERFRAMGATDFECNTMRAGFTSPDEHLAAYRRFMERVTA